MNSIGIKKASKWRRYLNIILGISNNKLPRKSNAVGGLGGDPASTRRVMTEIRTSGSGMAQTTDANDEGTLLYCAR
jgi:hypothetical protein